MPHHHARPFEAICFSTCTVASRVTVAHERILSETHDLRCDLSCFRAPRRRSFARSST